MAKPWKIVDLNPAQSLKVCLRKIVETRIQETFSYEHGTTSGEDIESLHDMRVSARRLRAVLRIFRGCFPKKKFRKQDEKLQGLIRSLGTVREQDVFIELLVQYRDSLSASEGGIIDLLIAREVTVRTAQRRHMIRDLRTLHRAGFADSLVRFMKESL